MKNVLFINPCLRYGAKRKYVPVGLAYILTAVEKARIGFDLIDMDVCDMPVAELRARLTRQKYDVYAFGCIVSSFKLVREIAALIREVNPAAVIIAGNSVASSIPELLLKNTEIDIAVMGEGDVTIVELLTALAHGTGLGAIEGIAFLEGGAVVRTKHREPISNLDLIGFPKWDLFDIARYNNNMLKHTLQDAAQTILFPLNAARGCPFSCTFCYHAFKGMPYRKYSEEAVVEEIKRLYFDYKASFIVFWDELTFPNVRSLEQMVARFESMPFKITWEGVVRGDLFKKKDVALIKRAKAAGCTSMSFSIENASPEILKAMNKRICIEQLVEHSLALQEGGVTPFTSIIFGYPQETPESVKMTLDLCEKCNIFPSVGFLQPLPGTPIYDWALRQGFIKDEVAYLMEAGDRQDFHINLTAMPTDEFVAIVTAGLNGLAKKMGLKFDNPLKTGVYQKPKSRAS